MLLSTVFNGTLFFKLNLMILNPNFLLKHQLGQAGAILITVTNTAHNSRTWCKTIVTSYIK